MKLIFVSMCFLALFMCSSAISRQERTFPGAKTILCPIDHQQLKDLNEIIALQASNQPTTSIATRYKENVTSSDECTATFAKILAAVAEIATITPNDKISTLESEKSQLQILVDNLKRNADQQTEIALDQQKGVLQNLQAEVAFLKNSVAKLKVTNEAHLQQLARYEIERGEIEVARDRILALENRDQLVAKVIEDAYGGKLNNLKHVTKFAISLSFYSTQVKAIAALFREMRKHGHLGEPELLLLFYNLKNTIETRHFAALSEQLKNEYRSLQTEMKPEKQNLVKSLMNHVVLNPNVETRSKIMQLLGNNIHLFASDVAQELITSGNVSQFHKLIEHFLKKLPLYKQFCHVLKVSYEQMKAKGQQDSLEAFQVFLWARYKLFKEKGDRSADSALEKCMLVHDQIAATNVKQKITDEYIRLLKAKSYDTIKNWHWLYGIGMTYFLEDLVKALPATSFTNLYGFDNVVSYYRHLPFVEDWTVASAATQKRLKELGLDKEFQGFRNMEFVRATMRHGNYKYQPALFKAMCESTKLMAPKVFIKLLFEDVAKCRLVNRKYDEPLYCPTYEHKLRGDFRKILTWVPKDVDPDTFWNIGIENNARVSFNNNYHRGWSIYYQNNELEIPSAYNGIMRTIFAAAYSFNGSKPWASNSGNDMRKFWLIEAVDYETNLIRMSSSSSPGHYLYASTDFSDSRRRYAMMGSKYPDGSHLHWTLSCLN